MFHTKKKTLLPYFLIAPVCIILLLFSYLPFPHAVYLSLNKVEPITGNKIFVGLDNFKMMLREKNFWESMGNTGYFVLVTTVGVIFLGLIAAMILNSNIKGTSVYMTILFIPWIVSDVVCGFSWKWLFNANFGLLNYLFLPLGIKPSNMITNPRYAMLAVVMVTIWKQLAYSTILLLAGLQNVSKELIESAKLDGCSGWKAFRWVILPILSPVLLITVLLDIINFVSQSGLILVLTNGGPLRCTETMALYLYREAFADFHLTNASTISIFLAIINILVVIFYFYFNNKSRKWVE